MKAILFFVSWLITLFVGLLVVSAIGGEIGLITTMAAAAISAPFILVFCIVMHHYIKRKPSKSQLHMFTLLVHGVGSIITVGFLALGIGNEFPWELFAVTFGYFAVDSLFFHAFIQTRYTYEADSKAKISEDILDAPLS